MKKNLLSVSLIFSFVVMSCLVCSVALAQEGEAPPEGDASLPSADENGMTVEGLMTDISEDMKGVLDSAAQEAFKDEEKSEELKMDEEIKYEDLEVRGDARILPDSFLYNFKNFGRGIDTFFTFDPVKKAEKELDYANKKIMESHQLVEEKGMSEAVANAVEKTIVSAGKDLEDISNTVEKLKEQRVEEAPKVEEFLDKITDHTLIQQKVIEKLEEQLPEKNLAKVIEAKEKALEHFGDVMVGVSEKHEDITERINKAMNKQEGSELKDLKNLEVLEVIKEKVPEEARKAIENVQENRIMVFQEKFKEMPVEERTQKIDRYLGDMKGNALRQFDMLDDMKRSTWVDDELIKELDMLKDKMVKKFEKKFAGFKETAMKDQFMGHLMDGDPDDFRTLEQIEMRMGPIDMGPPPELEGICFDPVDCEQYCAANSETPGCAFMRPDFGPPPEVREAMKKANEETVNKFKTKFANDPEALKRSEAIQRALSNPDAIDFKLLDVVYESMPEEQKIFADQLRKDVEGKMMDMMKGVPMGPPPGSCDFNNDGMVDQYESQQCAVMGQPQPVFMMDRFIDTNPETMKILKDLQSKVSETDKVYIEQAMNQQMNRMTDKMYKMDDQQMFDRMKYQMQEDITVKNEIEKRNTGFFNDIDARRQQLEEELRMLDQEKMRRMDEMKVEMMRGQMDFQQFMPTQEMMMGQPPKEMMMKFEEEQRKFQNNMREKGVDPCDFNNDGRVDGYESSQCKKGQQMAPPQQEQGFFNRVINAVPFRGQEMPKIAGSCDFNNDGYVDIYESKQCPQMPPLEPTETMPQQPATKENQGFFNRMRNIMPFGGQGQGETCGGGICSSGDYCANPANGWCCPKGMTYDAGLAGPGPGCVGESTPPPQQPVEEKRGFFDRMREYVPFMAPKGESVPAPGASCDFNGDGRVDGAEQTQCGQTPSRVGTACNHDGTCGYSEDMQSCPDDCGGTSGGGLCNRNGACENGETTGSCPEDCDYYPDHGSATACNHDGACGYNENQTYCPDDCGSVPTSDSCDFNRDGQVDQSEMDRCSVISPPPSTTGGWCGDNVCGSNESPQTCSSDCRSATPSSWCGDNVCALDESSQTCPTDCGGSSGGTNCDYDGICDWDESLTFCPDDCNPATMSSVCDNDGSCDYGETMSSCPSDCGTSSGGGMMSCTSFVPIGQSCNPMTGTCCSSGVCSNTSGPGTCGNSGYVPPSNNGGAATACNYNGTCDSGESSGSCPNDCSGGYVPPTNGSGSSGGWCGDNVCGLGETMSSCPSDCGTSSGGGMMSCTSFVPIGQSCNPMTGTCCSDGMCSNTSGPGTCGNSGYVPPSNSSSSGWCGDGACDGSMYESSTSCPADCGSGGGDYVPPPASNGCQCSCGWSESCDCAFMCPEPPPATTPPPDGGNYIPPTECPPEGCVPMSVGEYPRNSWLRKMFAFIFGF